MCFRRYLIVVASPKVWFNAFSKVVFSSRSYTACREKLGVRGEIHIPARVTFAYFCFVVSTTNTPPCQRKKCKYGNKTYTTGEMNMTR